MLGPRPIFAELHRSWPNVLELIPHIPTVLAVALGGAIGALVRYFVSLWALELFGTALPWGTLFINVTGSFFIGLVVEFSLTRAFGVTPLVRVFLTVGILGGYTTFSTYALETLTLLGERAQIAGIAYAFGSVVLGVAAAFGGVLLARALVHA